MSKVAELFWSMIVRDWVGWVPPVVPLGNLLSIGLAKCILPQAPKELSSFIALQQCRLTLNIQKWIIYPNYSIGYNIGEVQGEKNVRTELKGTGCTWPEEHSEFSLCIGYLPACGPHLWVLKEQCGREDTSWTFLWQMLTSSLNQ